MCHGTTERCAVACNFVGVFYIISNSYKSCFGEFQGPSCRCSEENIKNRSYKLYHYPVVKQHSFFNGEKTFVSRFMYGCLIYIQIAGICCIISYSAISPGKNRMKKNISRRCFMKLQTLLMAYGLSFLYCRKNAPRKEDSSQLRKTESGIVLLPGSIGPILYGTPLAICGANVKGKPNFKLLGNFGMISGKGEKPVVYISSNESHYTNIGIRDNGEFSICFPIKPILAKADYCGVVSGHRVDKSTVFPVQYGALASAPLIKECNICFSCKVIQQFKVNNMEVFFGDLIEKYGNRDILVDGNPDLDKIKSVTFGPGSAYRALSSPVGKPLSEYKRFNKDI